MGKSIDGAEGCIKIGCIFDVIGGLFIFYGFIIQFGDSSTFGERFGIMLMGLLIICVGIAINAIGGIWGVGKAAGAAASALVEYIVNVIIDLFTIKDETKRHFPNALKAQILAKKNNAVHVGIFDGDNISSEIVIKSNQGVSDSVQKGQLVYLN